MSPPRTGNSVYFRDKPSTPLSQLYRAALYIYVAIGEIVLVHIPRVLARNGWLL